METILLVIGIWFIGSIPVALLLGHFSKVTFE